MPSAGYSHFYDVRNSSVHCRYRGVNALGGLFSFLPILNQLRELNELQVSMPSAGYSHFYFRLEVGNECSFSTCVNALGGLFSFLRCSRQCWRSSILHYSVNALGGLFSFLHRLRGHFAWSIWCQCPRRAILISTKWKL